MLTLQKGGDEGGLGMTDIECKCKALLLSRGYKQFNQHDSFTSQWLTYCFQFADIQNPPNINAVPQDLQYIRIFLQEWSYIAVPGDPRDRRVSSIIYSTLIHHQKIRSETDEDYTETTAGKMGTNLEEHSITFPTGHSTLRVVSCSA
jgi:hypothetical protein